MRFIQGRKGARLMLAAMFSVCLLSSLASGQSAFKGSFELKDEVRWGDTVLTAGEYSLTFDSLQVPLRAIVRSANGNKAAVMLTLNVNDAEEGGNAIFISKEGEHRQVHSLNLPRLGLSLVYGPSNRKQEASETAAISVVPLAIAGR